MSNRTTGILTVIAVYCAIGYVMYRLTGNAAVFLPVPPFFWLLVILYWASVISDGIMLYKEAKRKKRRRIKQIKAKTAETAMTKAG